MNHVVLDMPYQVAVHGTRRRSRTPDVWLLRRTMPVQVRSVDGPDVGRLTFVKMERGKPVERACAVVDGRLFVSTGMTPDTWRTDFLPKAIAPGTKEIPVNPTSIRSLSERPRAHYQNRIVKDDFTEILTSDVDEASAGAVRAGEALLLVDGVVHTSLAEPVLTTIRDYSYSATKMVRTDDPPSALVVAYDRIGPCRTEKNDQAWLEGTAPFATRIRYDLFERAAIATRCIESVFPYARATGAMIGNGQVGSTDIPDALEDAVYGLRDLLRGLDGPCADDLILGSDVSDALERFVEEAGRCGPRHVSAPRQTELRNLLAAAESAAVAYAPAGGLVP